jgi:hypothetical protein
MIQILIYLDKESFDFFLISTFSSLTPCEIDLLDFLFFSLFRNALSSAFCFNLLANNLRTESVLVGEISSSPLSLMLRSIDNCLGRG